MIRIDPSDKQEFWAEPLTEIPCAMPKTLIQGTTWGSHLTYAEPSENKTSSILLQESGYSGENKWKRPAVGTSTFHSLLAGWCDVCHVAQGQRGNEKFGWSLVELTNTGAILSKWVSKDAWCRTTHDGVAGCHRPWRWGGKLGITETHRCVWISRSLGVGRGLGPGIGLCIQAPGDAQVTSILIDAAHIQPTGIWHSPAFINICGQWGTSKKAMKSIVLIQRMTFRVSGISKRLRNSPMHCLLRLSYVKPSVQVWSDRRDKHAQEYMQYHLTQNSYTAESLSLDWTFISSGQHWHNEINEQKSKKQNCLILAYQALTFA